MGRIFKTSSLLLIGLLFFYCAPKKKENKNLQKIQNSNYKGFLFTAHKNYESSVLYFYNFKTGDIEEITRGQSGDPKLFLVNKKVFLFNRKSHHSNYLIIDTKNNFSVSKEHSLQIKAGDPHSIAEYRGGTLLLSCPAENSLRGLELEKKGSMRLYHNPDFTPGNLVVKKENKDYFVYTLSLGTSTDYSINGSQKLYIFKNDTRGKTHPTHSTFSETLFPSWGKKDEFFSFSLGYKSMNQSKASLDKFNLAKEDSKPPLQINNLNLFSDYSNYGPTILGDKNKLYSAVKNIKTNKIEIRKFHLEHPKSITSTLIHSFESEHTYPPLLVYDTSTKTLLIGEGSPKENGKIHIYFQDKKKLVYTMDLHPYQGILVPS